MDQQNEKTLALGEYAKQNDNGCTICINTAALAPHIQRAANLVKCKIEYEVVTLIGLRDEWNQIEPARQKEILSEIENFASGVIQDCLTECLKISFALPNHSNS